VCPFLNFDHWDDGVFVINIKKSEYKGILIYRSGTALACSPQSEYVEIKVV